MEPSGHSNNTNEDSDHTDHFPRLLDSLELIRRRLSGQVAPQSPTILQSREWEDSTRARRSTSSQRKLNTSAKEYCHKFPMAITMILRCVLDSCRILESEGIDVTYLPVLPRYRKSQWASANVSLSNLTPCVQWAHRHGKVWGCPEARYQFGETSN